VVSGERVAGSTSTGSKRSRALFGAGFGESTLRMTRSEGARLWDEAGREYLDFVMALGAVGLGYAHPEIIRAVHAALLRGGIGSLPPVEEEELAARLAELLPRCEQFRFFKSGAEAVAAAVRLARTHTRRDAVLGCGYHGWLDWCSDGAGVPAATRALYDTIPFNDPAGSARRIRDAGASLACVVIEPVIDAAPDPEWLGVLREETRRSGALLVFDEIKTWLRVGFEGASGRWDGEPDLMVLGKALANGFPLAAVGGPGAVMAGVERTWISSTLATDAVAFAAAIATLRVAAAENLPARLEQAGGRLLTGLGGLAAEYPKQITAARGLPQMCYLELTDEAASGQLALGCAARGLLFKRNAYNFVSLAHRDADIDTALFTLRSVLDELGAERRERP
jgi:glutamate-1-semialdehyde 2,1-aminomutase